MLSVQHLRSFVILCVCAAICMACGTTYDVEAWGRIHARHINLRTGDTLVASNTAIRATEYGIQLLFSTAPMLSISSGRPSASRKSLLNNVIQDVHISANRSIDGKEPGENLSRLFLANIVNNDFLITLDSFVRRPPVPVTEQLILKFNSSLGKRDTITFKIDLSILPQRRVAVTLPPAIIE